MDISNNIKRKIIYLISDDSELAKKIENIVTSNQANFFHCSNPKQAVADTVAKNPDLIVYDEKMSSSGGLDILNAIRKGRPQMSILLLTLTERPQQAIDTTGKGVSYDVQRDANNQMLLDAIKHSIGFKDAR